MKQRNNKIVSTSGPAKVSGEGPRRRTWKESRELESLPAQIEELENRRHEIHTRMADPGFYQEAGDGVAKARRELETGAAELARVYARWEELEGLAP
jgi:ATP-binding cassette subfamily F protein uup